MTRTNKLIEAFNQLSREAQKAVDYIVNVISDYDNAVLSSEFFSNVLLIENYKYNPHPTGDLKSSTWGRKGVYVFIVSEDYILKPEEVAKYSAISGAGFWDAPLKQCLKKGDHFYQGSTIRKSLHTRLKEHYSDECDQAGIKLNNKNRIIMKDRVKVFVFPIRKELECYHFFIRLIESRLHEEYPAKSGSKKTF